MFEVTQGVGVDLLLFEPTPRCVAVGDHACIVALDDYWPVRGRKLTLSRSPEDELDDDALKDLAW